MPGVGSNVTAPANRLRPKMKREILVSMRELLREKL
jgi:hypothetical protein